MSQLDALLAKIYQDSNRCPERVAIKSAQSIYFINAESIVYIQADGGLISGLGQREKRHNLPFSSLQKLDDSLNPNCFFKINRSGHVQKKLLKNWNAIQKTV